MNPRCLALLALLGCLGLGPGQPVRGEVAAAVAGEGPVALALEKLRNGRQAEAEKVLAEAVVSDGHSVGPLFWQAVCIRSRFDLTAARPAFATVISRAPASREAVVAACMLGIDFSQDWGSALHYYQGLLALGARHPDDLGILWLSALAPRSLLKFHDLPVRLRASLANRGIDAYRELLARFSPGEGPVLVHQTLANLLDERGDEQAALVHREAAVRMERKSWSLQAYGVTLNALGRCDEAVKVCREAISLRPDFGDAYYVMGLALWSSGHADDAFAAWDAAGQSGEPGKAFYYGRKAAEADEWARAWDYFSAAQALSGEPAIKVHRARAAVHLQRPGASEEVLAAGVFDFQGKVVPDKTGDDPWFLAVASGDIAAVRTLATPENLERQTPEHATALMIAARSGWVEIMRELIDRHAKLDTGDGAGSTALHYAAQFNQPACVGVLLAAGAKPDLADRWGQTPLINAVCSGNDEGVRQLLEHGADVRGATGHGGTALDYAVGLGDRAAVQLLLAHGADANAAVPATGETPLMLVCRNQRHFSLVQPLLAAGADVHRQDKHGRTALHAAFVADTNADLVEALLAAGADPRAPSAAGITPITEARGLGLEELAVKMEAGRPEAFKMPAMPSLSGAEAPDWAAFTWPLRFACGQPFGLLQAGRRPDRGYARDELNRFFGVGNAQALRTALEHLKRHQSYDQPGGGRAGLDVLFGSLADTAFFPDGGNQPPDDTAWEQAHRIYLAELGGLAGYLPEGESREMIREAADAIARHFQGWPEFSASFMAGVERFEGWNRARYQHLCDLLGGAAWSSQAWPKDGFPAATSDQDLPPPPVPQT